MLLLKLSLASRGAKIAAMATAVLIGTSVLTVALAVSGLLEVGWVAGAFIVSAGLAFGTMLLLEEGADEVYSREFVEQIELARKYRRDRRMTRSVFQEFKRRVKSAAREYAAVRVAKNRIAVAIAAERGSAGHTDLISELLDADSALDAQMRSIFSALRGSADRAADPALTTSDRAVTKEAFRAARAARDNVGSAGLSVYR